MAGENRGSHRKERVLLDLPNLWLHCFCSSTLWACQSKWSYCASHRGCVLPKALLCLCWYFREFNLEGLHFWARECLENGHSCLGNIYRSISRPWQQFLRDRGRMGCFSVKSVTQLSTIFVVEKMITYTHPGTKGKPRKMLRGEADRYHHFLIAKMYPFSSFVISGMLSPLLERCSMGNYL